MKIQFSPSFIFGIGDADLQVVGEKFAKKYENTEETMWMHYAKTFRKTFRMHTPAIAVDRYHRWEEDIQLIKKLGIKNYRTSVSMARLLTRNGEENRNALDWYRQYFKNLYANGIKIYATLYHWELPQYLEDIGGWTNPRTTEYFLKHAAVVYEVLGEFIEEYFILNEPWCSSMLGYFWGYHAPWEKGNLKKALLTAHNLLIAQGLVVEQLKQKNNSLKLSTIVNVEAAYSSSSSEKDLLAARRYDGFFNRWFLDPVFLGKYPEDLVELYGKDMPRIAPQDMKIIQVGKRLHALGLNYYNGNIISYDTSSRLGFKIVTKVDGEKNDLGWPIFLPPHHPEGLYDITTTIYSSYKRYGLKKIYITENGIAVKSTKVQKGEIPNDSKRIEYMKGHIAQIYKAICNKVPIQAYFAWTLMDNFEWSHGYNPNGAFGLIYVNRKNLQRILKKSAYWYKKVIKQKSISI